MLGVTLRCSGRRPLLTRKQAWPKSSLYQRLSPSLGAPSLGAPLLGAPSLSTSTTSHIQASPVHGQSTDTFLQGAAGNYVAEMFDAWKRDPQSVHVSWRAYFQNMEAGAEPGSAFSAPPTLVPIHAATEMTGQVVANAASVPVG